MSPLTYVGLAITILLIAGLAIYSGTKVKKSNAKDNSAAIVTGVIMGTLVGGSATVGTAQLDVGDRLAEEVLGRAASGGNGEFHAVEDGDAAEYTTALPRGKVQNVQKAMSISSI